MDQSLLISMMNNLMVFHVEGYSFKKGGARLMKIKINEIKLISSRKKSGNEKKERKIKEGGND